MAGVTEPDLDAAAAEQVTSRAGVPVQRDATLLAGLPVVVVAGAGLALAARQSSLLLLIAVAVVQGAFALAWVFGVALPGRWGSLVVAALAAGGADFAVSYWPHARLGTLLGVLGLAVPIMYLHQLARGAARVRVVASLGSVAVLVLAEVALPAFVQLRHEFARSDTSAVGGRVAAAAVGAIAAAIVVGYLVDLVLPLPRFDVTVPRGMPALIASTLLGGAVGYLMLRGGVDFVGGRSVFVGAALGALAGLLAVGAGFVLHSVPAPAGALGRTLRPAAAAVLPLAFLAPVAFLICLSIRS